MHGNHSTAKDLYRILAWLGAATALLGCFSFMKGHLHADTHHHNMTVREKDRMKESFFSSQGRVRSSLARIRQIENQVVHSIGSKIHHISSTIKQADENIVLDSPRGPLRAKPPGDVAALNNSDWVGAAPSAKLMDDGPRALSVSAPPPQPLRLAKDLAPQVDARLTSPPGEFQTTESGEDSDEGEEDSDEHDLSAAIDDSDMDKLVDAALKGRKEQFDTAMDRVINTTSRVVRRRRHKHPMRARKPPDAPQGQALPARAAVRRPLPVQGLAHLVGPRAPERERPVAVAKVRRRSQRPQRCGGVCILKRLRRGKQSGLSNWVTDSQGNFTEDGSLALDDGSSCRGTCGSHGFCRSGTCVCAALYEGARCDQPRDVGFGLTAAFGGSFLFNADRLRGLVGSSLQYKCNPKKGSRETHSVNIQVSEELLQAIPKTDPLQARLYDKCAIVGNSGVLGKYRFGKLIDSFDAVFRFNVGPTNGYEDKVGSRTTYRLVNTNHAGWHEKQSEVDIQQLQSKIGLLLYLKHRKTHPNARLFAFDPQFSVYVSKNLKVLPTGGFFAIWLALQKCAQLFVYGFHFEPGFGIGHHYFNSEKPSQGKAAIHDYKAEYKVILHLARNGFLRLMEPCIAGCEKESGVPCLNCPRGSACQCGTGNPMPVASAGYCRARDSFSCFLKCPPGFPCPSQLEAGAQANLHSGACSQALMELHANGTLQCEPTDEGM